MARSNGSSGVATGKVANVVYYQLNGQKVIRGIGVKKKIKSKKLLAQQNCIKVLMQLFNKIKPFIKAGFKNEAAGTIYNYHNLATAYNRKHAITLSDQQATLHYDKLRLSQGHAALPAAPVVIPGPEGLRFTWDIQSELPWSATQDQVMMLAWFPEINEALFSTAGALRSSGSDQLPLPPSFRKLQMEVYMAFVSQDRESVSNSIYLGSIAKQN